MVYNMPKNTKSEKAAPAEVKVEAPVVENKKAKSTKAAEPAPAKVEAAPAKVEVAPAKVSKKTSKAAAAPVESPAPVKAEATESVTQQEGGKRRVRYFRCIYTDDTFGRFSGYKPKQAAGKALTSILRHREKEGQDLSQEVSFSMVECTRGGSHKVSQYTGKRVKLEKPVTVTIKTSDGKKKEINYNFTNKITKVKSEKKVAVKGEKKATKKTAKKAAAKKPAKKVAAKKATKKTATKKATEKKAASKKSTAKKTEA